MKANTYYNRLRGLIFGVLLLSSSKTCYGQDSNNQTIRTVLKPSRPINRPYSYRVTTGSTHNAGWEKTLTDGNPNLKRWTWLPVTSYNQGFVKVEPGKDASGKSLINRPASGVYVKPQQLSPNAFVKPRPVVIVSPPPVKTAARNSASTNVNGRIRLSHQELEEESVPATYSYAKDGQYGSTTDVSANLYAAKKDVKGKLLNKAKNIR
jgi:hypothetical protein